MNQSLVVVPQSGKNNPIGQRARRSGGPCTKGYFTRFFLFGISHWAFCFELIKEFLSRLLPRRNLMANRKYVPPSSLHRPTNLPSFPHPPTTHTISPTLHCRLCLESFKQQLASACHDTLESQYQNFLMEGAPAPIGCFRTLTERT